MVSKVALAGMLPDSEISSGLAPQDRVIESPPDGVGAGDTVRVAGGKPGT